MRYIFMNNFRGFEDTLIPLRQTTFLVGENSTGKSSFLKLVYLMSQPGFWFRPEFAIQEETDLGGFRDIVSAGSPNRSFFQIGVLTTTKNKKTDALKCSFSVHSFIEKDGAAIVSRYLQCADEQIITLLLQPKKTRYKTETIEKTFGSEDEIISFFRDVALRNVTDDDGLQDFPRNLPPDPPLPVAVGIVRTIDKKEKVSGREFTAEIPFAFNLTWIAPIRTKPQRFYDGTKRSFSPEGDHTPFILRQSLTARSKSKEFAEKIQEFGQASGLFETVIPHTFGSSSQAPFEILIRLKGAELNMNNVGYGISQVLPLIVEFLSGEKKQYFAVQQPEVHLHPRAQAALGDLIFELAKEKQHSFLLETHSDYLIDRYRLRMHDDNGSSHAQVVFFHRFEKGNRADVLVIEPDGKYPSHQPPAFRDFFVREEVRLLEV